MAQFLSDSRAGDNSTEGPRMPEDDFEPAEEDFPF
jgi:hypothetical protein